MTGTGSSDSNPFAEIHGESPTTVRYQVLALMTFAAVVAYLARIAVSVAESTIRDSFCLTLRESGWFMGAFFWSYAVLQIPSGSLAHRKGTRFALTLFAGAWSLAALLIGMSTGLWVLMTAQLLMGAAQAGAFPASCLSISHWIPLPRRSFACGVLAVGMQLGAISAGMLTGPLIEWIDWRWVFVAYSVPGFVWAILFWTRFRDDPAETPSVNSSELDLIKQFQARDKPESHERPPTPWGRILLHPSLWFLCGQQMCRAAGYMFFASWFPTFLQETRNVSIEGSGYLQAFVFTGTMTGSLCGGLLTDWLWRRTGNLRISRSGVGATFLIGCAALILGAWFVESTVLAVALLAAGALFAALAGPCAFSATIDMGGDHVTQVFGLMNMMGNLATAATPILVAELFTWKSDWTLVLVVFAGVYFLGAICWLFVDPRVTIRRS